jgi:PKHD-type hydroxylase
MMIVPIPKVENFPPYAYWDDGFTRSELDKLQAIALEAQQDAIVGYSNDSGDTGRLDQDVRRSKVKWLLRNDENSWVYQKLGTIISNLNFYYFRFDIQGFGEDIQMTSYDSNIRGMYNWHIDNAEGSGAPSPVRKLSVVMQLSEPGEYEGGDLQILHTSDVPITLEKKRGRVFIFPSYKIHRVTPVTIGSRQSLVCWLTGPALR